MDLKLSDAELAFRREAREWLQEHVPADGPQSTDSQESVDRLVAWERQLFEARWSVVSWPRGYGGREASLWEWLIFEEEYYQAEGPLRITQNGIFLLAPTLFSFGTQDQRDRVLRRMAAAEDLWAQGWSEPGAGSDLAAVRSRGERDEERGGWRISGQKTWTTRGGWCTHLFGLFRTDPEASRHRGLTYLMLPLDAPGVTVRPFARLDGDPEFAEVYLDDVFVPDHDVIGEPSQGWQVAMATTGSERGLTLRSPGRFSQAIRRLARLMEDHPELVGPRHRQDLAELWTDAEAYRAFTLSQVTDIGDGIEVGARSSLNKLFWSEMDVRIHTLATEVLGPTGVLDGPWARGYQFSLGGTIYAGTNEIQRNIVAERLLGLPRA